MKTLFSLLAMAVIVLLYNTTTFAEEKVAKEVTTIVFTGGATYDGKVPSEFDPVVGAVKKDYPDATFNVKDHTLQVGLKSVPSGKVLTITWKSDCPVNSQFGYPAGQEVVKSDFIRPILVAWTQVRHAHLGLGSAPVDRYNNYSAGHAEVVLLAAK